MNKFDPLFDSTTIINIPFIAKLFKRYLKSSIFISFILISMCACLYFLQHDLYWTSISFSDSTEAVESPLGGVASLMGGGQKGGLRATDILNLRSSVDFNRKIALSLMSSEFYKTLRFDLNYLSPNAITASVIERKCKGSNECIVLTLAKLLPAFYQITDKDRSGANFVLEVKSLDSLTSNVLLKHITDTINSSRVEALKYKLQEQSRADLKILIEKKKEIDINEFYEIQEERNRLESELKEIQSKIDHQTNVLTSVQDKLSSAEATYQRSKKASNKKVNYDEMNSEMRRRELKDKILKLNSDIIALEDASIEHSINDREILVKLKKEMSDAQNRLKKFGEGDSQTNLDQFVKQNDEKIYGKEMDFNVIKDQMNTAQQYYDELILKKKDIFGQKIKTEQNIEILKPSIEFIKNMEIKIEQTKLKALSIGADVRFDSYSGAPEPAKKIGLILILGYLVIMHLIVLTFYLIIRFYFDDNIYDEEDLKSISVDLKIIGSGPNYG